MSPWSIAFLVLGALLSLSAAMVSSFVAGSFITWRLMKGLPPTPPLFQPKVEVSEPDRNTADPYAIKLPDIAA